MGYKILHTALHARRLSRGLRELPAEPRWTPISEGLPEERRNEITKDLEYILCTMKNGSVVPYKFWNVIGKNDPHFWGQFGGIMDDDVVAWMYLPDAYVPVEETVEETIDPVEERARTVEENQKTVEETTVLLGDAVEKLDKAIAEYNAAMTKSLTKWCNKITAELLNAKKKLEEGNSDGD